MSKNFQAQRAELLQKIEKLELAHKADEAKARARFFVKFSALAEAVASKSAVDVAGIDAKILKKELEILFGRLAKQVKPLPDSA